jgi:hypothetical protein
MRAEVGAICGLGRETRFFVEVVFVTGRLGGALVVTFAGVAALVAPGAVFVAAEPD